MLSVLPLACFLSIWATMARVGAGRDQAEDAGWRPALLAAAAIWAGFLSLSNEILSLFHGITAYGLGITWGIGTLVVVIAAWKLGVPDFLSMRWRGRRIGVAGASYGWSLVPLGVLLLVLLLVALVSPTNTTDSLLYHMPRVVQWQQNGSLANFPTAYYPELWNPIWAEESILQLKVLVGSDQASNLIQWLGMAGSILAAFSIVRLLDGRRSTAFLTVAFIFSLPIGILESTSTQTDYVASFWVAVFVYFAVLGNKRSLSNLEWVCTGLALGVGVLTKPTVYLVGFAFMVWLLWGRVSSGHTGEAVKGGLITAFLIGITNLGYWWRNITTFGGPLGASAWVADRASFSLDPRNIPIGLVRQILLNFATPSEAVNHAIVAAEHRFENLITTAPSPFQLVWSWNNEDLAGNPIHVLLILAALLVAGWLFRRWQSDASRRLLRSYTVASLMSCVVFSWFAAFGVYGVRYQISLFVVLAPLVGIAFSEVVSRRWIMVLASALIVISIPWILFNQTRPLIGWRPRTTVNSVLGETRQVLLFANWPKLRQPYAAAAAAVAQTSCKEVGLVVDSHDPEYLLWASLGAPENGVRLEVLDPLQLSARFADPAFRPCAVLCTICGADRKEWDGLPLAGDFNAVRLYVFAPG